MQLNLPIDKIFLIDPVVDKYNRDHGTKFIRFKDLLVYLYFEDE